MGGGPRNAGPSLMSAPTDPAGGTEVTLSDDGNALATLSGASVSLYGVSYTSFYVGANGYVTFTASDGSTQVVTITINGT